MTYPFTEFSDVERIDISKYASDEIQQIIASSTKLRDSQKETLEAISEYLDADGIGNDSKSGFIKRPTGTGKTVIMGTYLKALQGLYHNRGLPQFKMKEDMHDRAFEPNALILVPNVNLANQTKEELTGDLVGFDDDEVAVFNPDELQLRKNSEKEKEAEDALKAPVTIMTYAAYRTMMVDSIDKERDGGIDKYDGLRRYMDATYRPFTVMDEADAATGNRHTPVFKELARRTHTIGFSATTQCIDKGSKQLINVADALFRTAEQEANGESINPIDYMSFADGVRNKEIAPTKNIVFELDTESHVTSKGSEYTKEERKQVIEQEGRDEAIVKHMADYHDEETGRTLSDMQQIWYCNGRKHAKKIAGLLNEMHGENYAVAIDGDTKKEELERILKSHKEQGIPPVLVNANLLIRGFDSPATEVCVMLRPTKSRSLAEQAGGRVARLDKNNPHKIGFVINFVDKDTTDMALFGDVVGGMFIKPDDYHIPNPEEYVRTRKRPKVDHRPRDTSKDDDQNSVKKVNVAKVHTALKNIRRFLPSEQDFASLTANSSLCSITRMSNLLSIGREAVDGLYVGLEKRYNEISEEYAKQGINVPANTLVSIEHDKKQLNIPYSDMGEFSPYRGVSKGFYVDAKHVRPISDFLGLGPLIPTQGWTYPKQLHGYIQEQYGSVNYNKFRKNMDQLSQQVIKAKAQTSPKQMIDIEVEHRTASVPLADLELYRVPKSNGKTELCVKDDSKDVFSALFQPYRTADTGFFAVSNTKIDLSQYVRQSIFGKIQRAYKRHMKTGEEIVVSDRHRLDELTIPSDKVGFFTSGRGLVSLHIHEDMDQAIEDYVAPKGLSYERMAQAMGGQHHTILQSIYADITGQYMTELYKPVAERVDAFKVDIGNQKLRIPVDHVKPPVAGKGKYVVIDESEAAKFKATINEQSRDALKASRPAKRDPLKPDSSGNKR